MVVHSGFAKGLLPDFGIKAFVKPESSPEIATVSRT